MKKFLGIILSVVITCIILVAPISAIAAEDERVIYLTFDDGPSYSNTEKVIDILKANDVRATFFVVGENVKRFPDVVKKLDSEHMAIYPHCNNHTYRSLYSSEEHYLEDLEDCKTEIFQAIGKEKEINFVRMPGGSDNLVGSKGILSCIKKSLNQKGINYIDWNIDAGDALSVKVSLDNIKRNIKKFSGSYPVEVLLMHDLENKDTTTQALIDVIQDYKAMGYKFKTLDEIEPWEMDYLKRARVINR